GRLDGDPDHAGVQVRLRALPLRVRGRVLDGDLLHPARLRRVPEPYLQSDGGCLMAKRSLTGELPHAPLHAILAVMTLYTIYPVLWVICIAFSGRQNLAFADLPPDPGVLDRMRAVIPWPQHFSATNFVSVLGDQPFARWMLNSAIVSAATTILGVSLACSAAYAFSRFKFPGRQPGMLLLLVSQMFPGTLTLIPLYIIIVQWLGLGSSMFGL